MNTENYIFITISALIGIISLLCITFKVIPLFISIGIITSSIVLIIDRIKLLTNK